MSWFNNLRICKKLLVVFSAITVLVMSLSGISMVQISGLGKASSNISDHWMPTVTNARKLQFLITAQRTTEYMHIVAEDADEYKTIEELNAAYKQKVADTATTLEGLLTTPEGKSTLQDFKTTYTAYNAELAEIITLS